MLNKVFVKHYNASWIDEREILRYAGYKGAANERIQTLLSTCIAENQTAFSYRVCYLVTETRSLLQKWGEGSTLLSRRLQDSEYTLLFAATVGLEIDRRILRAESTNSAKALLLQAFGAERIESLCDAFCGEVTKACEERGYTVGSRFSAGYGDFPLERQRDIFALLDCERGIGLTLNDSLLMTPTKSVTALLPIGKKMKREEGGCAICDKQDCPNRK